MSPTVSVIVVTYNHRDFLAAALDGIVQQAFDEPFEVIVHDDASTDGTTETLRDYARRYPDLIKPIYQTVNQHSLERGRVTRIVNAAAKGKYIALCEGDDIWTDPSKLAKQVAVLESDLSIAGTYHATRIIDRSGNDTGTLMRQTLPEQFTVEGTMSERAPFHTSSFVYRVGRYPKELPAWTWRVASVDMVLFTLVAAQGRLKRVEGVMSSYRKHEGGITNTPAQTGAYYDWQRILLWLFVDREFNYRYTGTVEELFLHHWKRIQWATSSKQQAHYLFCLFRDLPGWFLRKPRFSLARMWSLLKR